MAREMCLKCKREVKHWHRRTYQTVYPKARQDLKNDKLLRPVHYPDCDFPEEARTNKELVVGVSNG